MRIVKLAAISVAMSLAAGAAFGQALTVEQCRASVAAAAAGGTTGATLVELSDAQLAECVALLEAEGIATEVVVLESTGLAVAGGAAVLLLALAGGGGDNTTTTTTTTTSTSTTATTAD